MSLLNDHIPVTKYPDLMLFGVSAFGSEWLAMDGMSQIVKVLPGSLLNHASNALLTVFL
jgi:hypothetical protein